MPNGSMDSLSCDLHDSRNRRGKGEGKKRLNAREARVRNEKAAKREEQSRVIPKEERQEYEQIQAFHQAKLQARSARPTQPTQPEAAVPRPSQAQKPQLPSGQRQALLKFMKDSVSN